MIDTMFSRKCRSFIHFLNKTTNSNNHQQDSAACSSSESTSELSNNKRRGSLRKWLTSPVRKLSGSKLTAPALEVPKPKRGSTKKSKGSSASTTPEPNASQNDSTFSVESLSESQSSVSSSPSPTAVEKSHPPLAQPEDLTEMVCMNRQFSDIVTLEVLTSTPAIHSSGGIDPQQPPVTHQERYSKSTENLCSPESPNKKVADSTTVEDDDVFDNDVVPLPPPMELQRHQFSHPDSQDDISTSPKESEETSLASPHNSDSKTPIHSDSDLNQCGVGSNITDTVTPSSRDIDSEFHDSSDPLLSNLNSSHIDENDLSDSASENLSKQASQEIPTEESSESDREKYLQKRWYVLKELVETEKDYVSDLGKVAEGYMKVVKEGPIPEDLKGKEKMVFGNIQQIYEWHRDVFSKEVEKCEENPERLASLFIKYERRLQMYVIYCQNKPKSEFIVSDFIDTYFEEVKQKLGHRLQISDLLIKPVQRIMKYQLLLKDFAKHTQRAGLDTTELEAAVQIMLVVPKRANDMMNVGRLQGFDDTVYGKLTAQGKLILQDILLISHGTASAKAKERRVFLFEQLILFSEELERKKGFSNPGYVFKHCIKINVLTMEENVDDDPCRFALMTKPKDGERETFIAQAKCPEARNMWVTEIGNILDKQQNFLRALQSPIEFQKELSKDQAGITLWDSWDRNKRVALRKTQSQHEDTLPELTKKLTEINISPRPQSLSLGSLKRLENRKSSALPTVASPTTTGSSQVHDRINSQPEKVDRQSRPERQLPRKANSIDSKFVAAKTTRDWQSTSSSVSSFSSMSSAEENGQGNHQRFSFPTNRSSSPGGQWRFLDSFKMLSGKRSPVRSPGGTSPTKPKDFPWSIKKYQGTSPVKRRSSDQGESLTEERLSYCSTTSDIDNTGKDAQTNSNIQVVMNYTALKEDEISVSKGEIIQVQAINQHNMYLVYRPASDASPAAEGWIPGFVLSPSRPKYEGESPDGTVKRQSWHTMFARTKKSNREKRDSSPAVLRKADSGTLKKKDIKMRAFNPSVIYEGRPGEPCKPEIKKKAGTSIMLKWDAPRITGNAAITGYNVEIREKGTNCWQAAVAMTTDSQCTVDDLQPGATYLFRVSAHNAIGMSLPSEASDPVTIALDSGRVSSRRYSEDVGKVSWATNFEGHFSTVDEISRGRFAVVSKYSQRSNKRDVAVKFIVKRNTRREYAESEVAILQSVQHTNLNAVISAYDSIQHFIIVLELIPGGRLLEYIIQQYHQRYTEWHVVKFINQLLDVIIYLHNCRIVHLDIKPENLLVDSTGSDISLKLIDFGDSVHLSSKPYFHSLIGTSSVEFTAPEVVFGQPVTLLTDMWSIGVLTYVLLSGVSPFLDESTEETCVNIVRVDYSFPDEYFTDVSQHAKEFVSSLLVKDCMKRRSAKSAQETPWIENNSGSESLAYLLSLRTVLPRFNDFISRRQHQNDVTPISASKIVSSMGLSPT